MSGKFCVARRLKRQILFDFVEEIHLAAAAICQSGCTGLNCFLNTRHQLRTLCAERIKTAGFDQCLDRRLIAFRRVDPLAEIEQTLESPTLSCEPQRSLRLHHRRSL